MALNDNNLYFVGGVVRDEILSVSNFDTDYCYVGNAISFAKTQGLNIIKENPAFGTVRVLFEGKEIDIASTRKEIYPSPGHLPKVIEIGCSLEDDLKRRDFTINAMAKRTTDGEIVDLFNGLNDIRQKKLRVLHKDSFKDDPTRILRGLKFSVRFGFSLEDETKQLQDEYLQNINYDMSYHRLKKELVETFNLNKQVALEKFINDNLFHLLGNNQNKPDFIPNVENCLSDNIINDVWLAYLACFNMEKIDLTRKERRILEWVFRLKTENPTNNTPKESILIHEIWSKSC